MSDIKKKWLKSLFFEKEKKVVLKGLKHKIEIMWKMREFFWKVKIFLGFKALKLKFKQTLFFYYRNFAGMVINKKNDNFGNWESNVIILLFFRKKSVNEWVKIFSKEQSVTRSILEDESENEKHIFWDPTTNPVLNFLRDLHVPCKLNAHASYSHHLQVVCYKC